MKLFARNNQLFFQFAAIMILIGSLLFYLFIDFKIRGDLDKKLWNDHSRVVEQIQLQQTLPQLPPKFQVEELTEDLQATNNLVDTILFDAMENEEEPFRQLTTISHIGGGTYRITIRSSLVEAEDLLFAIGSVTVLLFLFLLAGLYWLNRWQVARLWDPFQRNLASLRNFSLSQTTPLELVGSDIDEFEELRQALQQLSRKVQSDYRNLKEFTENASHEIQTPLAIIRSKIEALIEDSRLHSEQIESIQHIYKAANRLSRLNKNLLLLAKIENRQFEDVSPVHIDKLVQEELSFLSDFVAARELRVKLDLQKKTPLAMSKTLAEVLVRNLLENAIRHCQPGDTIEIKMEESMMSFINSGAAPLREPDKLFKRFHQQDKKPGSMGLGLAIVDKIAETYNFRAGYQFKEQTHQFFVRF